jgi:hypothetical protein
VRECSHTLLDFLQRDKRGSFPELHNLLHDRPQLALTFRELPLFAASHSTKFVLVRLQRIESLLRTTVLVRCSSDPLHDIPVCKCAPFWTHCDDRRLLWSVKQNSLSALSFDCNEIGLHSDALFVRFEALIAAARSPFLMPDRLPLDSYPSWRHSAHSPVVRDVHRELGLLSPVEIANLTHLALRFVSAEIPRALLDLETLDWVDFFDRLPADLSESPDRPADDRQFLVALSLYRTGQPAHSAVFAGATRRADAEQMLSDVNFKLAEPRHARPASLSRQAGRRQAAVCGRKIYLSGRIYHQDHVLVGPRVPGGAGV